jgi:hypothetical protein
VNAIPIPAVRVCALALSLFLSFVPDCLAARDDAAGTGPERGALRLSLDPNASIETGADLTWTCASLLGELDALGFRFAERRRAVGIPIRIVRTIALDHPLAYWLVVLQHEAFGHGGRAREFGSSADVHMGSPWQGRSSFVTFDGTGLSTEDLLRVYTGGSESNGWSATLLERELVSGRPMAVWDLLYLIRSRWVASDYVLRTTPDPETDPAGFYGEWSGGGDVANYLGYLNTLQYGEPGITPEGVSPTVVAEYDRLRRQAYWGVLDPGAWIAAWALVQHWIHGDDPEPVPLPRLGGRRFLPVLSNDWLPEGGIVSVEAIFGPGEIDPDADGPRWFSLTLRRGRGPAGSITAAGAATERLWETTRYRFGGEVEVWARPDHPLGGGARLRVVRTRGALENLFLDLGVKSDGHWPGRPAGVGPFVRLGWTVDR